MIDLPVPRDEREYTQELWEFTRDDFYDLQSRLVLEVEDRTFFWISHTPFAPIGVVWL